jgi:hypothetical protein
MDIGAWLRGLGFERYEPAFRDNDIDAEVLFELTPEDLTALELTRSVIAANCSRRLPCCALSQVQLAKGRPRSPVPSGGS